MLHKKTTTSITPTTVLWPTSSSVGPTPAQDRRRIAQQQDVPALLRSQREKRDQKLEVQIGRDHDQFEHQRRVPEAVEPRRAAGQFDKADRRLNQLMQRQPQILDVPFLREIERQQKKRQARSTGWSSPGAAGARTGCVRTTVPVSVQVGRIAEAEAAVGEKDGVGAVSQRDIEGADRQGEMVICRRHSSGCRCGKSPGTARVRLRAAPPAGSACRWRKRPCPGREIPRNGGVLRHRQLDQQRDGPVAGSQLDMQPEPDEGPCCGRQAAQMPSCRGLIALGPIEVIGIRPANHLAFRTTQPESSKSGLAAQDWR